MRAGTPSRTYSERYGARSPWLVERWRVVIYLIWRALFALLRPALFLALCVGAVFFLYRAFSTAPAHALKPAQSLSERFDAALIEATSGRGPDETLALWRNELDDALAPGQFNPPDLPRARSFAASLPSLMGREALALHLMRDDRRPELMRADLAAMPVWRRNQIVDGVLEARLQSASHALEPVWLVEAAPHTVRRHAHAQALYGRSFQAAEAWFHTPDGQALNLAALPGLLTRGHGAPVLVLPDAREVIVQGCALARARNQTVPACHRARLDFPDADPVRAALALSLFDPSLDEASVRLALAARAAGRLEGDWLEELMMGPSSPEREMRVLTALMPLLSDADRYAARPETCRDACRAALSEFARTAGLDQDLRRDWFASYEQLLSTEGALVAIRVSDLMVDPGDIHALARMSEISEGRLLAAHLLIGPDLIELGRPEIFFRPDFIATDFVLAGLLAVLATLLLGIVLIQGHFRRSGGAPGALERLDGQVSRLILGRNL